MKFRPLFVVTMKPFGDWIAEFAHAFRPDFPKSGFQVCEFTGLRFFCAASSESGITGKRAAENGWARNTNPAEPRPRNAAGTAPGNTGSRSEHVLGAPSCYQPGALVA